MVHSTTDQLVSIEDAALEAGVSITAIHKLARQRRHFASGYQHRNGEQYVLRDELDHYKELRVARERMGLATQYSLSTVQEMLKAERRLADARPVLAESETNGVVFVTYAPRGYVAPDAMEPEAPSAPPEAPTERTVTTPSSQAPTDSIGAKLAHSLGALEMQEQGLQIKIDQIKAQLEELELEQLGIADQRERFKQALEQLEAIEALANSLA